MAKIDRCYTYFNLAPIKFKRLILNGKTQSYIKNKVTPYTYIKIHPIDPPIDT